MHEESTILDVLQPSQSTARVPSWVITPSSVAKTALVWVLAWVLAWKPGLAMCLGRLVLRVWPSFRRA
jgi:hypothetical protein